MDPKHRDRIAFLRVCSGKFERDMAVLHRQTGKTVRLSSSHKLFGQERETVDEAWPGDVIGLVGHDAFGIGDTLAEDRSILFDEIPRFAPEVFAYLSNPSPADAKKYRAGVEQLLQEGVVQSFSARQAPPGATLLAAVGPLQFEVVQYRLQSEYGAASRLVPAPWTLLRWLRSAEEPFNPAGLIVATGVSFGSDKFGQPVALFPNEWTMRYFTEKEPGDRPVGTAARPASCEPPYPPNISHRPISRLQRSGAALESERACVTGGSSPDASCRARPCVTHRSDIPNSPNSTHGHPAR